MKRRKLRTNVNGSSGRPKSRSLESVDRISVFPDSILGIILSFLPTKNAVSTAVLSKRWKLVWTMVHNLDLCYDDSLGKQDERDDMRLVGFVNRVLLLRDVGWLNKFRLVWTPRCIPSHASSWISTAVERNVHELFVCVETPVETLEMPISVFNCNLLQSVELKGNIFVSTASVVCLPRLESLKLVSVLFQSEEAFEKLVSRCLKLTYLHLHTDFLYEKDDFIYMISSTSLKRLEVHFDQYQCGLKLNAPSLEYLEIIEYKSQFFVQKSLSSLVEANLRINLVEDDFSTLSIIEVIRAFDSVNALSLSGDVMRALGSAKFFLSTKFKRLAKFEATICCSCIYSSLHDLMEHNECLEVLTINQEVTCMHENNDDHSEWTTPVEVPRCLSSCLKSVIIEGYHGFEDEREMIGYILKHGVLLNL